MPSPSWCQDMRGGGADPAAVFDPGAVPADRDVVRDRLRALRHAQGWSQAELGRRLGVASITVSRWETKEHLPSRAQWGWFLRLEAGEALLQPRPEDRPKGVRVVVRDGRVLVGVGSATNLESLDPDAAVRLAFRLVEAARVCDRAPAKAELGGEGGRDGFSEGSWRWCSEPSGSGPCRLSRAEPCTTPRGDTASRKPATASGTGGSTRRG
jgi:Helix-turn-helix domain